MVQVGDLVVYLRDGARGIVIRIEGEHCHVMWEDDFVSWEKTEWLEVERKQQQRE